MRKIIFLNITLFFIFLIILEGAASFILAYKDADKIKVSSVHERKHTQFDSLLGWINKPNLSIENLYGKGVFLHTNNYGFRNREDSRREIHSDSRRILCVGDSFTFGYGVSNDQTWCHLLSKISPRVETVNMGQGGYGVDQAYLWYKRDGVKMEHSLIIFAFVTADFYRMQENTYEGYSKPFLYLKNSRLEVEKPAEELHLTRDVSRGQISSIFTGLRLRTFLDRAKWYVRLFDSSDRVLPAEFKAVVSAIFSELNNLAKSNNSKLMLVHLPNFDDYPTNLATDSLRVTLQQLSNNKGLSYVDLVKPVQSLNSGFDAHSLFQFGNNHYSVKGNEYIKRLLRTHVSESLQLE